MISISPTAVPSAVASPSFAERFIGQKLIRQDLPFGYKDLDAHGTRILGRASGYESISDALTALETIDRVSYGNDPRHGKVHNAVAVVRNDAATGYALLELDKALIWYEESGLVGANHFRTYDPAVVAAVNGVGHVLENQGPE